MRQASRSRASTRQVCGRRVLRTSGTAAKGLGFLRPMAERVPKRQHVTDGVRRRQGDGHGADHARIDQGDGKAHARREPLEPPKIAGTGGGDHHRGGSQHAERTRDAEIGQCQADTDELCDDRESVENEKID
ncbi:MAG: hypothetical protein WB823_08995, partial [Steroidobacteraceae bacterium]